MNISKQLVRKYQRAYEQKHSQCLPDKQAELELANLAELVKLMVDERTDNYGNQSK